MQTNNMEADKKKKVVVVKNRTSHAPQIEKREESVERIKLESSIVVRKYEDLKPFFEAKAKNTLNVLNNQFIAEIKNATDSIHGYSIGNGIANVATGIAIVQEIAKANKIHLEVILTPEMKQALENGLGSFQQSHKVQDNLHTMFQWRGGRTENITLREVPNLPNISNIALLMNQMQMQQTLQSIQNTLMDFAEETNRQLRNIRQAIHDDRVTKTETAKLDFETFLKEGNSYKNNMLSRINEAFANLRLELKRKLEELEDVVEKIKQKTSVEMKKLIEEEQTIMNAILETLDYFHVLSNIETYLAYIKNESDFNEQYREVQEVQKKYSDILLEYFTDKRLKILSGLCTLPKDIWRENFMPCLAQIKQSNEELLLCQRNAKESITAME